MTVTPQMEKIVTLVLEKTAELHNVQPGTEVSVALVDDEYIRSLNREYRGKDCSTDVLSFSLTEGEEPDIIDGPEEELLGDIIISLDTTIRQAEEFGHSVERELAFLTVHGMLHLLGYDHEQEAERQDMRSAEEEVLLALQLVRDTDHS